jgi:hypothetical protein
MNKSEEALSLFFVRQAGGCSRYLLQERLGIAEMPLNIGGKARSVL